MSECNCAECRGRIQRPIVCQDCQMTAYCSEKCRVQHEKKHRKNWCDGQKDKLIEAYCEASAVMVKEFPNSKMATMSSLSWEGMPEDKPQCLVARIMWNISYFRICIFVVDPMGAPCFVAFYLESDPSPHFKVKDIQPGNVIIVNRAQKHQFMDGQVGLRLEDPSEIRIVRV